MAGPGVETAVSGGAAGAALARELAEATRRLAEGGLIVAREGNASARLPDGEVVGTPAGARKGDLGPADMVRCDFEGRLTAGSGRVSSEILVHLAVYRARPDARAVVHAHPPTATAFAAAGVALDPPILAEAAFVLGRVATAPYHPPGSPELAAAVAAAAAGADAILLANHGALTLGRSPAEALERMETLERCAVIALMARVLGGGRPLPAPEIARLLSRRS